jgi:hypothetical protein
MSGTAQQQIDPNLQVSITLPANEWQIVLMALDEAPMPKRISAPLAARIIAAVTEAAQTGPEEAELIRPPPPSRGGPRVLPDSLRDDRHTG